MCIYKTTVQEIKIQVHKECRVHKIIGCHYSSTIKCSIQKPLLIKVWFCFLNTLDLLWNTLAEASGFKQV